MKENDSSLSLNSTTLKELFFFLTTTLRGKKKKQTNAKLNVNNTEKKTERI